MKPQASLGFQSISFKKQRAKVDSLFYYKKWWAKMDSLFCGKATPVAIRRRHIAKSRLSSLIHSSALLTACF